MAWWIPLWLDMKARSEPHGHACIRDRRSLLQPHHVRSRIVTILLHHRSQPIRMLAQGRQDLRLDPRDSSRAAMPMNHLERRMPMPQTLAQRLLQFRQRLGNRLATMSQVHHQGLPGLRPQQILVALRADRRHMVPIEWEAAGRTGSHAPCLNRFEKNGSRFVRSKVSKPPKDHGTAQNNLPP